MGGDCFDCGSDRSCTPCARLYPIAVRTLSGIAQPGLIPPTVLITTRSCLIAADLLVLVVTWRHTYKLRREASAISLKTPMVTLLLRDGAWRAMMLRWFTSFNDSCRDDILHVSRSLCAACGAGVDWREGCCSF